MLKRYRQTVYENALRRRNGEGGGPSPPFSPLSITGLSLWLDGTTGFDGSIWTDQSTALNYATRDSSDGTIATTTINDNQALEFSNGRMFFQEPKLFAGTTGSSVFIVVKPSTTPTGHPIGTQLNFESHFNYSDVLYENIGFSARQDDIGAVYPPDVVQIYENIANDGGYTYLYKNGEYVTDRPYGNGYTLADFNVGSPGYLFIGTICEVVIYNRTVLLTEREEVEGYLAWKWGLEAELPAEHPYELAPP
jgi:hypothetical protein